MLLINRETDYAGRIMLYLSRQAAGTRTTAQEVARTCQVPRAIVRRVVTRLTGAGLLAGVRGSGGGISLARPPEDITLLDVVQAMEGEPVLNACVSDPKFCPLMEDCTVHNAWVKGHEVLTAYLRGVTFARLAQEGAESPA